jgi:hypothetical protein
MRLDSQQFSKTFDLPGFDLNAPLAAGAGLEMSDRHRLSMEDERPGVGLGQPSVEAGHGDAQSPGGLAGGKKLVVHRKNALRGRAGVAPMIGGRSKPCPAGQGFPKAVSSCGYKPWEIRTRFPRWLQGDGDWRGIVHHTTL